MQIRNMDFVEVEGGADPELPLIYLWEILATDGDLVYWYVGKAKGGARRPRKHYSRNVKNLLHGRPYQKGKPDNFRLVHRKLAEATRCGHTLRLSFIDNVAEGENIDEAESKWRHHYENLYPQAHSA